MVPSEISNYYNETKHRPIRVELVYAVKHVTGDKVALDCGCGAGANIAYLRENNVTVFVFDVESESIELCCQRFRHDDAVSLSLSSFRSYPKSSLVVADARLFFCPQRDFDIVCQNIGDSLSSGGIF